MHFVFYQVGRLLLSSHLFFSKQQVSYSGYLSIILWLHHNFCHEENCFLKDFQELNILHKHSSGEKQSPFFSSTAGSPPSPSNQFTKCLHNTATVKRVSKPRGKEKVSTEFWSSREPCALWLQNVAHNVNSCR